MVKALKNTEVIIINNNMSQDQYLTATDIKNALNSWVKALGGGSVENIVNLYKEGAILLPTLAGGMLRTRKELEEYFTNLLSRENLKVTIDETDVMEMGKFASNVGTYTFSFTENGKEVKLPARFSFIYELTDKGCKIAKHHSSMSPEVQMGG